MTYQLYDRIRLLSSYSGPGISSSDERETCHLAAGLSGSIVDVYANGDVAVDVTLQEPAYGPQGEILDYGEYWLVNLRPDQIAPAR